MSEEGNKAGERRMSPQIGVLAYGSLIQDPGEEFEEAEVERRQGVRTPFRIEFARKSKSRNWAPTLVPVNSGGGAYVEADLIVLRGDITLNEARDRVYRREINCVGNKQKRYIPDPSNPDQVYVEILPKFTCLDWVLYTRIAANIVDRSPQHLAELAIKSAKGSAGEDRRDGITYLRDAISNGIQTPLSEKYQRAILRRTGANSLDEAWGKARGAQEVSS